MQGQYLCDRAASNRDSWCTPFGRWTCNKSCRRSVARSFHVGRTAFHLQSLRLAQSSFRRKHIRETARLARSFRRMVVASGNAPPRLISRAVDRCLRSGTAPASARAEASAALPTKKPRRGPSPVRPGNTRVEVSIESTARHIPPMGDRRPAPPPGGYRCVGLVSKLPSSSLKTEPARPFRNRV
jgi:hypothetical protein